MSTKLANPDLCGMGVSEGLAKLRARFRELQLTESGPADWEGFALEVFRFQAQHNPVYRSFCELLNLEAHEVSGVWEVPFMPVEFFASHRVLTEGLMPQATFRSSGTTGSRPSEHHVDDLSWYAEVAIAVAERAMGPLNQFDIHAMLPGYIERPDASLIQMVRDWMLRADLGDGENRFHLGSLPNFANHSTDRKLLLIGVTHALLDLAESGDVKLPADAIVMETGGMKGRRKEWVREAVHSFLKVQLGVDRIASEYGMTEMLSQAYALRDGLFEAPPWLLVNTREVDDPGAWTARGRQGRICVADLANIHSCAFLATGDLGRLHGGGFEVLGRHDHAEVRGCNLMVSDLV